MIACTVNRKGGCGKTLWTYQGGTTLAALARPDGGQSKILLVDTDSQASLSQILFTPTWVEALPKRYGVAALFDPRLDPLAEHIIHATSVPNLYLIPASDHLTEHNTPVRPDNIDINTDLAPFLHEVRAEYDHILIDCAP